MDLMVLLTVSMVHTVTSQLLNLPGENTLSYATAPAFAFPATESFSVVLTLKIFHKHTTSTPFYLLDYHTNEDSRAAAEQQFSVTWTSSKLVATINGEKFEAIRWSAPSSWFTLTFHFMKSSTGPWTVTAYKDHVQLGTSTGLSKQPWQARGTHGKLVIGAKQQASGAYGSSTRASFAAIQFQAGKLPPSTFSCNTHLYFTPDITLGTKAAWSSNDLDGVVHPCGSRDCPPLAGLVNTYLPPKDSKPLGSKVKLMCPKQGTVVSPPGISPIHEITCVLDKTGSPSWTFSRENPPRCQQKECTVEKVSYGYWLCANKNANTEKIFVDEQCTLKCNEGYSPTIVNTQTCTPNGGVSGGKCTAGQSGGKTPDSPNTSPTPATPTAETNTTITNGDNKLNSLTGISVAGALIGLSLCLVGGGAWALWKKWSMDEQFERMRAQEEIRTMKLPPHATDELPSQPQLPKLTLAGGGTQAAPLSPTLNSQSNVFGAAPSLTFSIVSATSEGTLDHTDSMVGLPTTYPIPRHMRRPSGIPVPGSPRGNSLRFVPPFGWVTSSGPPLPYQNPIGARGVPYMDWADVEDEPPAKTLPPG
eukprot:TRINITY_DN66617_c1_g1_i1.p1 TRINITY_DN66617_c1_g1~~TRINITY_DN66617_c1_g1_i1.p1  ORF type:complete len:588 (-),score=32.60 TRINITY_DN66617_c1_g1_i1:41-1804(-)